MQLHDGLALEVEGIRIMDSADDKLQMIFGTDLFSDNGEWLRERGTSTVGGQKRVMVEVGKSGSGELFELKVNHGTHASVPRIAQIEEVAELTAIPSITPAATDPILADPMQAEAVAAVAGANWRSIIRNLLVQLKR